MTRLKTVFHVHTDHSHDSNNSAEWLIELAGRTGVDCMVVADHNTLTGAREVAAKAGDDLKVIVGQEISTAQGHLIGVFLRERIEAELHVREAAEAIRRQGGLVIAPHPFNSMFSCGLRAALTEILDLIDIVEVHNAQNLLPFPNRRAEAFACRFAFPAVVGIDMHHGDSLDACYQWLEPFEGPGEFVESVQRAAFVKGRHPLSYFARSAHVIVRGRLRLPAPRGYGRHASARPARELELVPVPAGND